MNGQERLQMPDKNDDRRSHLIYELDANEFQQVAGGSDRPFKVLGIQPPAPQIVNELGLNPKDFDLTSVLELRCSDHHRRR